MEISNQFTNVHFTTTSWAKSESTTISDIIYTGSRYQTKKKRAKGFCLNFSCKIKDDVYKINDRNYRKTYSTDNFDEYHCPGCKHALFWTKRWELLDGYKDKEFRYKERPTLCK